MNQVHFNESLLEFLDASPTPFHAVWNMVRRLDKAGFVALAEGDRWQLKPGGRYYVVRNGSSIVAFRSGRRDPRDAGIRLFGAHTDSPCLRIKPAPELSQQGFLQLGVEVYGGALLNPWFDRDLSIAGRATVNVGSGEVRSVLVDFRTPLAVIPSLAIHLDREANDGRTINKQQHLPPIVQLDAGQPPPVSFRDLLSIEIAREYPELDALGVLDYDLSLYDTQRASLVGLAGEFIASARLDNLLSCHVGLHAMLEAGDEQPTVLVCNDHEEVGSASAAGAAGPMLRSVLERWLGGAEAYGRAMARSMLISADNAHAIHPNYADRHDGNHGPKLNSGPVIKINNNQRYATDSRTASLFRQLCHKFDIAVQSFVVRSDMACGSTIGPLTAAEIGVATLDVGVPQLAMHSIRELAGSDDAFALYRAAAAFYDCVSVAPADV